MGRNRYSARTHTRLPCAVPGGYPEYPDPLRGDVLAVAATLSCLWFARSLGKARTFSDNVAAMTMNTCISVDARSRLSACARATRRCHHRAARSHDSLTPWSSKRGKLCRALLVLVRPCSHLERKERERHHHGHGELRDTSAAEEKDHAHLSYTLLHEDAMPASRPVLKDGWVD